MEYKHSEEQKSRYKRLVKLYAKMLLNNDIDYIKLKNVYNRTIAPEYAEYKIKQIVRQRETQKLLESEILALYESEGITAKEMIKRDNDVYTRSLDKGMLNVSDKINERIGNRIGLNPTIVNKSISISAKTTDYRALLEGTQSGTEPPKQLSNDNVPPDEGVTDD